MALVVDRSTVKSMVISGSPGAACVIQGPREFLEHRPRVWLVSQRASRFSFNAQRAYRLGDQRGVLGLLLAEEARKIRVGNAITTQAESSWHSPPTRRGNRRTRAASLPARRGRRPAISSCAHQYPAAASRRRGRESGGVWVLARAVLYEP